MSSNSVCNHTRYKQIGLPLRGRPILLSLVWLQTELNSTQSYYHYKTCDLLLLYNNSEGARFFPWVYRHNNPQLIDQSERAHWFCYYINLFKIELKNVSNFTRKWSQKYRSLVLSTCLGTTFWWPHLQVSGTTHSNICCFGTHVFSPFLPLWSFFVRFLPTKCRSNIFHHAFQSRTGRHFKWSETQVLTVTS